MADDGVKPETIKTLARLGVLAVKVKVKENPQPANRFPWLGTGLAALLLPALVACGAPAGPAPESTPTQVAVASPTTAVEAPTHTPVGVETTAPTYTAEQPNPTDTRPPAEPTRPSPSAEGGEPGGPNPPADLTNPWPRILSMAQAPEGWSMTPCEGNAPALCVLKGADTIGYVLFNSYPLQTLPDFRKMLADAGIDATSYDYTDPQDAENIRKALLAFVESYHSSFEADRQATYGGQKMYRRLETKEVSVGDLPGVSYGFALVNPDGSVHERWLSYSTFDGEGLFTIVASYYPGAPDAPFSFRSDDELQQFEPFLAEVVNWLKLPNPEVRGDKFRG